MKIVFLGKITEKLTFSHKKVGKSFVELNICSIFAESKGNNLMTGLIGGFI